jgi:serine/threonine-protein kinase
LAEIARREPPTAKHAAEYVHQIALAVQYAHEQGVVHRDLKPSNVIVDADDNVRIIDFGLARRLDGHGDLTATGQVLGTAGYMPPEQAAGHSHRIGPCSDVYALGAVLYEMLTGRPPFRSESTLDTLLQVLEDEPVSPRLLNHRVPRDLETVCLKCLSKEPDRRFASAKELADELARFLDDHPTHTRPIGRLARYGRWCRRKPIAAGFLATVITLLLLAAAASASIAQHLEARLRTEVSRHNAYVALNVADNVVGQLQRWSSPVTSAARDAELRSLLAGSRSSEALQGFVREMHGRYDEQFAAEGETAPYSNWIVMDAAGVALARSPEPAGFVGRNYGWRDYFLGARQNAERQGRASPHISRVYHSDSDELFKFAISAPIFGEGEGDSAPVLGVLVATIATNSTFGLPYLNDRERRAVLVGRADRESPEEPPREFNRILVHDAYDPPGARADETAHPSIVSLQTPRDSGRSELARRQAGLQSVPTDDQFADPVEGGRWLAAFAPVGNTEFVVIVEQRYEDAVSWRWIVVELGGWLLAAALIVTAVMGAATWFSARRVRSHRRHQRQLAAPGAPA